MATLGMVSWSLLSIDDGIVPLVLALALAERFIDFEKEVEQSILPSPLPEGRN